MQVTVERVTVKPKVFDSGDEAWGVFSDNKWVDVFGLDHKPEKGETLDIDLKTTTKNGRTFYNGRVKPSEKQVEKAKEVLKPIITATKLYPPPDPESKPEPSKVRTTPYTHPLKDYEKLINRGFEIAGIEGVTDDAARVSLVAILCIAYGEGKLSIDDLKPSFESDMAGIPDVDGWGDREWFEGPKEDDRTPMAGIAQATKEEMEAATWTEAQQKKLEMEAAKARMDKFVKTAPVDNADYKTQLGAAIKTYCFNNKLDFKEHKFQTLFKCAKTMKLETLSQEQAKEAIEKLKVMP